MVKYNIGEKATVILYTDVNHNVGTPKQNQRTLPGTRYELRNTVLVYIYGPSILDYNRQ